MNRPRLVGGALAFLAAAIPAPAQQSDGMITVTSGWAKGDRICFESLQTQREIENRRKLEQTSGKSHDVFEIVDITDHEYIVRWTRTETRFDNSKPLPADAQGLMRLTEGLPVEFMVDQATFGFRGIRNLNDVRPAIDRAISIITDDLVRSGFTQEQAVAVKQKLTAIAEHHGAATIMLIDEVLGMLTPYGKSVNTSRETREDGRVRNPFGSEPLDATIVWLRARKLRANNEVYQLQWRQIVDRSDLARLAREMLRAAGVDETQIERRHRQIASNLVVTRSASYVYDASNEIVLKASITNHHEAAGNGTIKSWEWTVVECDAKH